MFELHGKHISDILKILFLNFKFLLVRRKKYTQIKMNKNDREFKDNFPYFDRMHHSKSQDADSKFMENAEPDLAPHKIIANPQPFCSNQAVGHLQYMDNMPLPTDPLYL